MLNPTIVFRGQRAQLEIENTLYHYCLLFKSHVQLMMSYFLLNLYRSRVTTLDLCHENIAIVQNAAKYYFYFIKYAMFTWQGKKYLHCSEKYTILMPSTQCIRSSAFDPVHSIKYILSSTFFPVHSIQYILSSAQYSCILSWKWHCSIH